jgi:hypothetical protein
MARRENALLNTPVALTDGKPITGPDLSVEVNGLLLPNPFVIGSGPPGVLFRERCMLVHTQEPSALRSLRDMVAKTAVMQQGCKNSKDY